MLKNIHLCLLPDNSCMMSNLSVNNLSQSIYHPCSNHIPMQEAIGNKLYLHFIFAAKQNDTNIWEQMQYAVQFQRNVLLTLHLFSNTNNSFFRKKLLTLVHLSFKG